MSGPAGLARLPGDVAGALAGCTAELAACTGGLDAVMARSVGAGSLDEMAEHRRRCAGAVAELLAAVRSSRRTGPDRARLAELARSADRTAEAVDAAAWAWARHDPLPELADVLRALRDATRAACNAADALEDEGRREVWAARCREREAEARFLARSARGALVAQQDNVHLAAAAQDGLTYAGLWLAAVTRLRTAVLRCSLE